MLATRALPHFRLISLCSRHAFVHSEQQRAEEASLARLEESLEDTTSALSDAVAEVQRLKRDLSSVESELGAVSRDKSKAQGEVKRLAQQLASEEAVKRSMKRKLDAFTSGSSSGGGLLLGDGGGGGMGAVIAGLQLQHLDLAECVCEVRNATNMDVSLAGWTVRVVADASLVVETAGPDGSVRASKHSVLVNKFYENYYFLFSSNKTVDHEKSLLSFLVYISISFASTF